MNGLKKREQFLKFVTLLSYQKKELTNVIDLKKNTLANIYRKKKIDSKKLRKIPKQLLININKNFKIKVA